MALLLLFLLFLRGTSASAATVRSGSDAPTMVTLPHLKLKRSFPSADTVLTSAPDAIRLWLSEPPSVAATRITVTAANGTALAMAKPTRTDAADAPLVASFTTPPAEGRYTVTWKTMSKDGHVVNGTFHFTIKRAP